MKELSKEAKGAPVAESQLLRKAPAWLYIPNASLEDCSDRQQYAAIRSSLQTVV